MKKPVVGQVLATNSGKQFLVQDVFSPHLPGDEDAFPDDYAVQLIPISGLHEDFSQSEPEPMLHLEFENWCKSNGISY